MHRGRARSRLRSATRTAVTDAGKAELLVPSGFYGYLLFDGGGSPSAPTAPLTVLGYVREPIVADTEQFWAGFGFAEYSALYSFAGPLDPERGHAYLHPTPIVTSGHRPTLPFLWAMPIDSPVRWHPALNLDQEPRSP